MRAAKKGTTKKYACTYTQAQSGTLDHTNSNLSGCTGESIQLSLTLQLKPQVERVIVPCFVVGLLNKSIAILFGNFQQGHNFYKVTKRKHVSLTVKQPMLIPLSQPQQGEPQTSAHRHIWGLIKRSGKHGDDLIGENN